MKPEELKRKLRKLKQLEIAIRFGGEAKAGASLVWDAYFDLRETSSGKAKYTLGALCALDRESYKQVINAYFALVYYEYYKENGITAIRNYDPEVLVRLGLPVTADEKAVKKRFRELAKKYHPDTGGDAARFIELIKAYEKLTGR